jgi:molybdopterin synthase catalytic subunit
MAVYLENQPFEPYQALLEHQRGLESGGFGASATFVGTMRDFNEGDAVTGMFLEHYPGMTEHQLEGLIEQARERWPIIDALIVHRIGEIHPGDPIVLVAVWSAHRKASLETCSFLIEELKHRATFWKKETLAEGERWVERNTSG